MASSSDTSVPASPPPSPINVPAKQPESTLRPTAALEGRSADGTLFFSYQLYGRRSGSRTCKRKCVANPMCQSEVCVHGLCLLDKQSAREACDDNEDCTTSACATWGTNYTDNTVCCPSGKVMPHQGHNLCKNLPVDEPCGDLDALCKTNVCFDGTCENSTFADFTSCLTRQPLQQQNLRCFLLGGCSCQHLLSRWWSSGLGQWRIQ